MAIFQQLEHSLTSFANQVPLELFSFLGSFIEEVIAPIPSPIVMTVTGSLAQAQEKPIEFLIILAIAGAFGKVLGSLVLYTISDKAEDFILYNFGKFFGVTSKEIESIGKHISRSWKDIFILTLVRSLPIIPSAPISVVCGLLKVRRDVFVIATFTGTIIRDGAYLYIGYSGLDTFESLLSGANSIETFMQGVIVLLLILFFVFIFHQKRKGKSIEDLKSLFRK